MYEALRELMKDEIQEEIQAERQDAAKKAVDTSLIGVIKNLMNNSKCDAKTAMEKMGLSAADQSRYLTML